MNRITIQNIVGAPPHQTWDYYTNPEHIVNWNFASPEWHCPWASNDLKPGGKYRSRMEARDGSLGFDFEGTYDRVIPKQTLEYTLSDGRKVSVDFISTNGQTLVQIIFEPEAFNAANKQREGWQAILDNFKQYVESMR